MSTPTSPSGPGRPVGATPIGAREDGDRRRKKGLLWGVLALVGLLALALLLSQCGGDGPATGTGAADGSASGNSSPAGSSSASSSSSEADASPSATSGSGGSGSGAGAAGGGRLVAGGQDLLQAVAGGDAAAALGGVAGETATATGVQVLSVPADEGFWVGASETDRVWVQLTGEAGESPYQVQEGDAVDFEGTVVAHDQAFAGEVGVDEAAGAGQLTEQGHHLEVAKSGVTLSE